MIAPAFMGSLFERINSCLNGSSLQCAIISLATFNISLKALYTI